MKAVISKCADSEDKEIRCPRCVKLLAKDVDGVLEIVNGKGKNVRVYGAIAVAIDCPRCGATVDLPRKMKVGHAE